MRRFAYTSTGRLTGIDLADSWRLATHMQQGWPADLAALLAGRAAGTFTAATPVYLVLSDGAPICWVNLDGVVVRGEVPLTRIQASHQRQATTALADPARHALARLADQRDTIERRTDNLDSIRDGDQHGWLRVANP